MANHNKLLTVLESEKQAVPKTLELIIKDIEKNIERLTENHLLIGVMYTLMLECGYCLSSNGTGTNSDVDLSNYNNDKASSRKIMYQTLSFSYENVLAQSELLSNHTCLSQSNELLCKVPYNLMGVPEYSFLLMTIPSGSQTVVNLLVFENSSVIDCFSVAFTPASLIRLLDSVDVALKFHNLKEFSILFKDNIALKGRSLVLNKFNSLNNSLEGMPEEILLQILKYLRTGDRKKVASLSSTLKLKTLSFRA